MLTSPKLIVFGATAFDGYRSKLVWFFKQGNDASYIFDLRCLSIHEFAISNLYQATCGNIIILLELQIC